MSGQDHKMLQNKKKMKNITVCVCVCEYMGGF